MQAGVANMRERASACVVLLCGSLAFAATVRDDTTSGLIRQPTTWGGTVEVVGDVTVDSGFTLTIEPGARVMFAYRCRLLVDGTLIARGTDTDTIVFTIADTAGYGTGTHPAWHGIRFDHVDTANDASTIEYCRLEYGRAEGPSPHRYGGAVFARRVSFLSISHCEFRHDSAAYGGAVYLDSAAVHIADCRFTGNAAYVGGAVYVYGCDPLIERCLFEGNRGEFGGGLYCLESSPDVFNCVFDGNTARTHGGGMLSNTRSWPQVYGCTFVNNGAMEGGGHYTLLETGNTIDIPEIGCSIFWNNGDELGGEEITVVDCCVKGGASGTRNIDSDPLLRDTAHGDYGLRIGSPCINAAGRPPIGFQDFAGNNRIFDDSMDIGAIEARCEVFNGQYFRHERWDADTVLVHTKAYVHTGFVLRIAPGTVVVFDTGGVRVRGTLVAQGAEDDSIVFVFPDMAYGFDGISLDTIPLSLAVTPPAFAYCRFQGPGPHGVTNGVRLTACEAPVSFDNCLFSGISAQRDQALRALYSNLSLRECVFRGNTSLTSGQGGAVSLFRCTSGVAIERCLFENNEAGGTNPMGGALCTRYSNARLSECVFTQNAGGNYGGAFSIGYTASVDSSVVVADRCELRGNTSLIAGAISVSGGAVLSMTNSLIAGSRTSDQDPGYGVTALDNRGGSVNLANCTFADNVGSAPTVRCSNAGELTAINCIFWNGGDELVVQSGAAITVSYSCVQGPPTSEHVIDQYPFFVDTTAGNFALADSSPCIGAGAHDTTGIGIGAYDLAGAPRIVDGVVDMGAYEHEPAVGSVAGRRAPRGNTYAAAQWRLFDLRGRFVGTIDACGRAAAGRLGVHGAFVLQRGGDRKAFHSIVIP